MANVRDMASRQRATRATGRVPNKHAGRAATPRRPHAARPLNTLYMTVVKTKKNFEINIKNFFSI